MTAERDARRARGGCGNPECGQGLAHSGPCAPQSLTRAQYRQAIADALAIERTAQERTRQMHADCLEAERRGFPCESEALRHDMDTVLADAAEQMADRLRAVLG